MAVNLFTTHFLVTTTPTAMAAVDLDALVAVMVSTERTLSLEAAQVHPMFKAVIMVVVAAVQEHIGQAHRVTAV